jgi:hypothetical protein
MAHNVPVVYVRIGGVHVQSCYVTFEYIQIFMNH